jgi:hypothetical protein
MVRFGVILVACLTLVLADSDGVKASMVIFSDDFDNGASPLWQNEQGNWFAEGGVYGATEPSTNPLTYSSLPFQLTSFSVEVSINDIGDGGIWLRSSDNGNGVLLVTGGYGFGAGDFSLPGSGNSLYWHVFQNGTFLPGHAPIFNPVENAFTTNSDAIVRVDVIGNTYSAFVNDMLITTLVDDTYAQGKVGLYDFYGPQTFDNVKVSALPEANGLTLCGAGLGALAVSYIQRKVVRLRSLHTDGRTVG